MQYKLSQIGSFLILPLVDLFLAVLSAAFGLVSIGLILFALTAQAQIISPSSEPLLEDDFTKFVEGLTFSTQIQFLDAQGLTKGSAGFEPWSGSYWPIHKGILGIRYAVPGLTQSKNFLVNYQNFQAIPATHFISSGRISELSPAEKYDLMVGDSNWTLTQYMWQKGLQDFHEDGFVAGWTGICHGWAAVSHIEPKAPHSPVTVLDVSGQHSIMFHANDIKGLLSYLWATSSPSAYRAGDRCRQGAVLKDSYLRPIEASCLDSNPMSWHLAVVNRVGLHKKSLTMDSSSGPEVWNYPITGYDYHYFDPKTFIPSHSLQAAVRPLAELPTDQYKNFRSTKAQYIVGIVMDVFHPALTEPTRGITSKIITKKMTFVYDLELDTSFNIVGGEWYAKDTPDFIWSFQPGHQATTRQDGKLRSRGVNWSAKEGIMTFEVAEMAREASLRGQVLSTIANSLLNASALENESVPDSPPEDGVAPEEEIENSDNNND